jgi:hypothetical protein
MNPYCRCCVTLTLAVVLKVGLPAQWSCEAGVARLAVPLLPTSTGEQTGPQKGSVPLPAWVAIFQAGKRVGEGELLSWLPNAGMAELRALLPKGRFRLGPPRPMEARVPRADQEDRASSQAQLRVAGLELAFEWRDGERFSRYRAQGSQPAVAVRADLYRYPGHGLEIRIRLCAGQRHVEDAGLRIDGGFPASWSEGRELRLSGATAGVGSELSLTSRRGRALDTNYTALSTWALGIPAGYLRPGDEIEILLLALEGRDPEERAIGPTSLRQRLGQGPAPASRRADGRLKRRMDQALSQVLSESKGQSPLDRGDHERNPAREERPALWSHQEFDLPLGLYLLGCERRDPRLLSAAWRGLQHMMGRDRSRPWRNETLGYRLPVRHGTKHGIGRVALGHVFLESALLVSALRTNRSMHEEAIDSLDALSDLVPSSIRRSRQLRDLAWPLVNLELGLRLLDRRAWKKSAESLLDYLEKIFRDGSFDLRESRHPGGSRSFDLWLVSGLLLPALDASVLRGSRKGRVLIGRLEQHLRTLPGSGGGYSTRYSTNAKGQWRASRAKVDPCYETWLIEGLLGRKSMPASLRSRRRRLLSELPGKIWDPATRLAFLLRWPRIRAEVR